MHGSSDVALPMVIGVGLLVWFRRSHGLPVWATVALAILGVVAATVLAITERA